MFSFRVPGGAPALRDGSESGDCGAGGACPGPALVLGGLRPAAAGAAGGQPPGQPDAAVLRGEQQPARPE